MSNEGMPQAKKNPSKVNGREWIGGFPGFSIAKAGSF
jgi:hypothetical protein